MGKSSGGGSEATVRYAPYVEDKHKDFLDSSKAYGDLLRNDSPYVDYDDFDFNEALYGVGYAISSFPSLYDMFGKFMAGLDIEILWDQVLNDIQDSSTIQAATNAHRDVLTDDIEQVVLPRFQEGMRDINAVMSSSFVIGKSLIEQGRNKKLAEFDANLRYKLIPVAAEVFSKHLSWNAGVISTYLQVMSFSIDTETSTVDMNYNYKKKNIMWPFTILEQERANIGALQGAMTTNSGATDPPSKLARGAGGAIGGAAMGATAGAQIGMVGGPLGALAGGLIGGIASIF